MRKRPPANTPATAGAASSSHGARWIWSPTERAAIGALISLIEVLTELIEAPNNTRDRRTLRKVRHMLIATLHDLLEKRYTTFVPTTHALRTLIKDLHDLDEGARVIEDVLQMMMPTEGIH